MEEKMESEQSYTGESSSSSDSCSASGSGSSEPEDEPTEPVRVLGQSLDLPQDLCENHALFKEFFSYKTWEALEDKHKEHLMKYLPQFTQNEEEEKEKTIKMLFDHEPFHFSSPLEVFYNNLKQGNYRPDIAKMRKFLLKARTKQQKHKIKSYYAKLMPEVLISRERLLAATKAAPPGPTPRLGPLPPKSSSKNNYKPLYLRARQRYFEELAAIRGEVGGDESEDDNYPEGPPEPSNKKRKQMHSGQNMDSNVSGTLGGIESSHPTSLDCLKNVLAAHRARRQYRENHPELNTTGLTLEDIKQRVALVNGTKKLMFGGQKSEMPPQKLKRGPKKESSQKQMKSDAKAVKRKEEESVENKPLLPNIKIKCEQEESDSESSFVEPVTAKHPKKSGDSIEIKQEIVDPKYPDNANINYNDPKLESVIKQEPMDPTLALQNAARHVQPVPIKIEDLDGIDMMALPVELADDTGDMPPEGADEPDTDEALTETTHANFLSLVRALFPARAAHRASKQQLHARCTAVMRSPIAPLNTWYSLSDDWCAELDSALDFLAGERGPHPDDFVPYLQYIPETQMYQWIGAGRDCDAILGRLCERWFRAVSPTPPTDEPPPPRYPTSWVVRPLTSAEIADFRAQERKRYAAAAKPFTYVQHGYRSVVGPCARTGGTVAGGAAGALLAAARPRHASMLALVRDAVARLPNGEGTRHDVLTLLKMSQWIAACSDQALLSALSTALDRLLSAKRDPVVKYDQRTAIWTYLHRNRNACFETLKTPCKQGFHKTEEDWIKSTARGRSKAAAVSAPAPAPAPAPATAAAPARESRPLTPPAAMELEVGSVEEVIDNVSDSDVDVDDSGAPPAAPALSSAQLLMQATLAQPPPPPQPNPKPKPKPTPKPKQAKPKTPKINVTPKPTPAQPKVTTQAKPVQKATPQPKAALMAQSAKQASLVAQAVKSNLIAQAAKQANVNTQPSKPVVAKTTPKPVVKQVQKPSVSPVSQPVKVPVKNVLPPSPKPSPVVKQVAQVVQLPKSSPTVVPPPQSSPLIRQRPLQKVEAPQTSIPASIVVSQPTPPVVSVVQPVTSITLHPGQTKVTQGTRSLLIRPPAVQTTVTAVVSTPISQGPANSRRGVVRVLSPATPASGKSLISPRALMQQASTTTAKKRPSVPNSSSITTLAQGPGSVATMVSAAMSAGAGAGAGANAGGMRTVQLAGGRTVQLAANQTVHLPGGQAVQLAANQTVHLPGGQAVQLAARALQLSSLLPRGKAPAVHIPVSTVQLTGQTVQLATSGVHLAGQSVQLTQHTVKLPGGQSVQVAPQTVQLPSGQTVQLAGRNLQSVQLAGQNVLSGQTVQVPSGMQLAGQTVQLAGGQTLQLPSGQTVQLPSGQTVQLPSGQTVQLPSGQTVQLSSGQTLQLASGQAVQLASPASKQLAQGGRQGAADKPAQPIVAKLLTNAQGQMISLESMMGGRVVTAAGGAAAAARARGAVRVLAPARPLLLAAAKPLHNIILQQSDGSAIRVTSSGAVSSSQTIVLSNIGSQTVTTPTASAPVLKLQQVNPIQQVKLPQGIKIQQAGAATSAATSSAVNTVRSVLMDGQQLKLVGGRHVLARLLRPAHPPQ